MKPQPVYVYDANLFITTRKCKNGTVYGDELSRIGVEGVQGETGDIGMQVGTGIPIYVVLDKETGVCPEHNAFQFKKSYAVEEARLRNEHVMNTRVKPYHVKKAYLIYPQ